MFRYPEDIALKRRQDPEDDIITRLLTAEPDGQPLTEFEFKTFFTLLMVAGNETTRHTISYGLLLLQEMPAQLEWWRFDLEGLSMDATEIGACR